MKYLKTLDEKLLLEFVENQKNTPLLYKDDNIEVKVSKTLKSSIKQNKNTNWCSSQPYGFYSHNRTADMFRINFSDGYKLRLTWDFINQRASELGSYSGGTHWGQGGIVDDQRLSYDVIRPYDNEDPFTIDWKSEKSREIVDRIKSIPDEAKLSMMEYHDKSSREKSEMLNTLYKQIEKIKVIGVSTPDTPKDTWRSNIADVIVRYLGVEYKIKVSWDNKDNVGIKLGELESKLKSKYVNYGRELSGYIYDKMMEFIKKNRIDLKLTESIFDIFNSKDNRYKSESSLWHSVYIGGVKLSIQPKTKLHDMYPLKTSVNIEKKLVDDVVIKISKLSKEWNLIEGRCELYTRIGNTGMQSHHIKFRLSDCRGDNQWGTDGEIPVDIKKEIIDSVHRQFRDLNVITDEFTDRGYILFDVVINEMPAKRSLNFGDN